MTDPKGRTAKEHAGAAKADGGTEKKKAAARGTAGTGVRKTDAKPAGAPADAEKKPKAVAKSASGRARTQTTGRGTAARSKAANAPAAEESETPLKTPGRKKTAARGEKAAGHSSPKTDGASSASAAEQAAHSSDAAPAAGDAAAAVLIAEKDSSPPRVAGKSASAGLAKKSAASRRAASSAAGGRKSALPSAHESPAAHEVPDTDGRKDEAPAVPASGAVKGVREASSEALAVAENLRETSPAQRKTRGKAASKAKKAAVSASAASAPAPAASVPATAPAAPEEERSEETAPTPLPAEEDIPVQAEDAPARTAFAGEEPADFPSGFDDLGPEDFFASQAAAPLESVEGASEAGEKRRRGRSRRGRGRRKTADQALTAAGPSVADEEEAAATAEDLSASDGEEDDEARLFPKDGDDAAEAAAKGTGRVARRKMFVSVLPEEQIEVVITEEGQVQEYYVEMLHQAKIKGNIYKGIVHNVDANLQAAFVSYGAVKNGFLQIDEVHPEYYVSPHDATKSRKYPPIQKVLKAGQELLVQIVKEPAGTKGAFLTTYLSMPGRFLVLTPGREQIGVSRKVENETERARLRELLEGLNPGPGLGVIVRTVSMGASKASLQRDLQYLKRTWKDVRGRGTTEKAPCLVYQEMDLTSRAVRDYLTEAVGEVWIDDEATAAAVTEIAEALFPRKQNLVRAHKDTGATLFERFNIQRQLDQIHSREVSLPSGGRLVIDPTEALTAIDINSGRSGGKNNFEDMAFRTNMEAARMIPLQLRLRDIGGQIVADFIEMRDKSHWREVEKTLRNGMKVDRARYDVGKIGPFGMLEIVRQRLGSSAISLSTEPCPCCGGTGMRRNMEWQSQHALRDILRLLRNAQAHSESAIAYSAERPLALHLLNYKRQRLLEMEQRYGVRIDVRIVSQEEE